MSFINLAIPIRLSQRLILINDSYNQPEPMKPLHIFVIGPTNLYAEGIISWIDQHPVYHYCGLFPDAPGFISSPAPEQDTGILLLMPGELPHCIEQMTALGPLEDKIKTVVICSKAMEEAAPVFFRQRAAACFPSDGTRHDLEQVLNEVALKGYCSNKLTFLSARHVDSGEADIIKRFASLNLTATERKVLRTLRDMPGSTRQQVAGAMNISLDTLQSHIRNINGKLGVKGHNAIEKVAEWIERG